MTGKALLSTKRKIIKEDNWPNPFETRKTVNVGLYQY